MASGLRMVPITFSLGVPTSSLREGVVPAPPSLPSANSLIVTVHFQVPSSTVCLYDTPFQGQYQGGGGGGGGHGHGVSCESPSHSASGMGSTGFEHLEHEFKKRNRMLDMGVHPCHPSTQEAETGGQQDPDDPVSKSKQNKHHHHQQQQEHVTWP